MDIRTDRVGVLVEQLTDGVALSRIRLDGVDDEEFLWEPVEGMWSLRERQACTTPDAIGAGPIVLDFDRSVDPFAAGPLSTIAWRIGHLASTFAGRYEWTFGARSADPGHFEFASTADVMFGRLWSEIDRWVAAVEAMSDTDLDQPGYGQYPWGLDPELPFIGIVRWMNRETIHHLAEVGVMRDLYAQMA